MFSIKRFFTASALCALAFLFSANAQENYCLYEFNSLRNTLDQNKVQMKTIVSDGLGVNPYLMLKANINNRSYVIWEQLTGEFQGYALRDLVGFDYNTDRNYTGSLSWHSTHIWDKLFDPSTKIEGYSCVIAGRTRIAGQKASLLKLTPQDGKRYIYVIAKDDETSLPIELITLSPYTGNIISKITSLDTKLIKYIDFPIKDELFDNYETTDKTTDLSNVKQLAELNIPSFFKLVDAGTLENNVYYQSYSDGLSSFRVYKTQASTNFFPFANKGTVIVFRKIFKNAEYAVVGDIPPELAEFVLSKL